MQAPPTPHSSASYDWILGSVPEYYKEQAPTLRRALRSAVGHNGHTRAPSCSIRARGQGKTRRPDDARGLPRGRRRSSTGTPPAPRGRNVTRRWSNSDGDAVGRAGTRDFRVVLLHRHRLDRRRIGGAVGRHAHADLVLALLGGRLPLERVGAGRREVA